MRLLTPLLLSVSMITFANFSLAEADSFQADSHDTLFDESFSDPYLDAAGEGRKTQHSSDGEASEPTIEDHDISFRDEEAFAPRKKNAKKLANKDNNGNFRSVEINLSPTSLMKDNPVAGGIGLAGEVELKGGMSVYVSADFNRYSDLDNNPIYSERPYNYNSLKQAYLDHSRVSAGGRYYLLRQKQHGAYVGGNLAFVKWQSDYVTDTSQAITSNLEESVVSAEAGYRWQAAKLPLMLRAGAGLGWSLPLTHEVTSQSAEIYEQGLAREVQNLKLYRVRPSLQLAVGYSY